MSKLVFALAPVAMAAVAAPAASQPTYTPYGYPNGYQGQYQSPYQSAPQGPYQSPYTAPSQSPYASPYSSAPNYPPRTGRVYGQPAYDDDNPGEPEEMDNYGGRYDGADFAARLGRIETGIRNQASSGRIDASTAARLRGEAREIRRLERQYSYGGIDQRERLDLQGRLASLRHDLRVANGRIDPNDRYGYDDRSLDAAQGNGYPPGSSYGGTRVQGGASGYASGNGYYDRPTSNGYYGRPSGNGYQGHGGPYEPADEACAGGGCLRIGQQAPGGLYGVPYEDRDRYRDGNGSYYRSDGRAIYRIDARTNTVLNVYAMDR